MSPVPDFNKVNNGFDINKEYRKANAAIDMHRWDLVISLMRGVLQVQPEATPAFLKMAYAYLQCKEYQAGVETCAEGVRLDAENDYAHALYGELLYKAKRYAQAEYEFQRAISLNPTRALNHYWYADYLLMCKKKVDEAAIYAAKALEIAPHDADYHVLMGMVRTRQRKPEQAAQEYKIALSIDPEHNYAINNYGVYLLNVKRRSKEALELFRQALLRQPNEPLFLNNLHRAEKAALSILLLVRIFNVWLGQKMRDFRKQIWIGLSVGLLALWILCLGAILQTYSNATISEILQKSLLIFVEFALLTVVFVPYFLYSLCLGVLVCAGIVLSCINLARATIKTIKKSFLRGH